MFHIVKKIHRPRQDGSLASSLFKMQTLILCGIRFEAFDEPWKVKFNKGDDQWEDKWGLMSVDRKLKAGLKIPDCGGKVVGSS